MKTFVLAAAAQQGISFNSLFNAPAELILPGADAGNDWVVNNYEDAEQGILKVIDGTRVSSNTLFAQLMLQVGPENVVNMAHQLGITSNIPAVPSLVLGSGDVSPFEMAVAYSTIARGGVYISPQVITKVVWPDGRVDTFPPETRQAIDPAHATLVTSALRRVVRQRHRGQRHARRAGRRQDRHHRQLQRRLVRRLRAQRLDRLGVDGLRPDPATRTAR